MIVDPTNPVMLFGLAWGRDHDLLALRAPHRSQGRMPTDVKFISIVEEFIGFQVVPFLFNRFFFTRYSGSGLLTLCWGRLMTISAAFKCKRMVSVETRSPVSSAI